MARITIKKITKINKKTRIQTETDCTYHTFEEDREKYIQFDTYGTLNRKSESKSSQTIQFDRDTAKYIIEILKREFNL